MRSAGAELHCLAVLPEGMGSREQVPARDVRFFLRHRGRVCIRVSAAFSDWRDFLLPGVLVLWLGFYRASAVGAAVCNACDIGLQAKSRQAGRVGWRPEGEGVRLGTCIGRSCMARGVCGNVHRGTRHEVGGFGRSGVIGEGRAHAAYDARLDGRRDAVEETA